MDVTKMSIIALLSVIASSGEVTGSWSVTSVYDFCSDVVGSHSGSGLMSAGCNSTQCRGPPGKRGPAGPRGPKGDPGVSGTKGAKGDTSDISEVEKKLQRLEDVLQRVFSRGTLNKELICYMGVKSRAIPNSAMTASSSWNPAAVHNPYLARLDNKASGHTGGWSSGQNRVGEWIQVDFGSPVDVSGVITQGRTRAFHQWVTSYKVSCGSSVHNLKFVEVDGNEKVFRGNFDRDSKVYNQMPSVLTCRFIRIYPQTFHEHMSMRIEFVAGKCFDIFQM